MTLGSGGMYKTSSEDSKYMLASSVERGREVKAIEWGNVQV